MKNIILTGGGTAGHCSPNLTLIPFLKKYFNNIYYIGSDLGIERKLVEKENIPYFSVPCAKLVRSFTLKNLIMPFKVLDGINKAKKLIDKLNPSVIFSKGGYVSLPVVIAGNSKKIPVISHESDLTVGLANKIASKYSKLVLTSFPETASQLKNGKFIGSPIKTPKTNLSNKTCFNYFGFTANLPVLLITGGSLGAKAINNVVYEALPHLTKTFNVIHLCGKGNFNANVKHENYFQAEFINNMDYALKIADICLSRAGANTLFELISAKIPCVAVPLQNNASRGDQILNAEYFYKKGLVYLLKQDLLTVDSLLLAITCAFANRTNIINKLENCPFTDKSSEIAELIYNYAKS